MKIRVERIYNCKDYCIGHLYINDVYFCDTLEDCDRMLTDSMNPEVAAAIKVKGKTAIPTGTYRVDMNTISARFGSNKFYKDVCNGKVPRILNVPGFSGILIHCGNTAKDTEGCLLVGKNKEKGKVLESRQTFMMLYHEMQLSYIIGQPIYITITRKF